MVITQEHKLLEISNIVKESDRERQANIPIIIHETVVYIYIHVHHLQPNEIIFLIKFIRKRSNSSK